MPGRDNGSYNVSAYWSIPPAQQGGHYSTCTRTVRNRRAVGHLVMESSLHSSIAALERMVSSRLHGIKRMPTTMPATSKSCSRMMIASTPDLVWWSQPMRVSLHCFASGDESGWPRTCSKVATCAVGGCVRITRLVNHSHCGWVDYVVCLPIVLGGRKIGGANLSDRTKLR